jgi:hypothetical protein
MFYTVDIQMESATASIIEPSTATSPQQTAARNDKRERKHTAQMLPPGITQSMMKKYVVYYREFINLKNGKRVPREYFKVESHPKLSRPWVSSKSVKISLYEKLESANQFVADLEKKNVEEDPHAYKDESGKMEEASIIPVINRHLPKYTNFRIINEDDTSYTYSLVYDQKDNRNGFRWTCSHTFRLPVTSDCPVPLLTDEVISLELQQLNEKLYEKYAADILSINHE